MEGVEGLSGEDKVNQDSFRHWMRSIASAAISHCLDPEGVYFGPDGAKRLARECGYAIPDFTLNKREQDDLISMTYSTICVIAYNLKPPIDASDWLGEMRNGRDKVMEIRKYNEVY